MNSGGFQNLETNYRKRERKNKRMEKEYLIKKKKSANCNMPETRRSGVSKKLV